MKRRVLLFALAILPLAGIFLAARYAATRRPQTITKAEFEARQAASAPLPTGEFTEQSGSVFTPRQQQLQHRVRGRGWELRAVSPDGTRLLAQRKSSCQAAILDAKQARILLMLAALPRAACERWTVPDWSGDGKLVWFQADTSPIQIFDAQTGQALWSLDSQSTYLVSSPDGRLLLAFDTLGRDSKVLEARTGHEVERLSFPFQQAIFSRDSRWLLLEIQPGQYKQWRLR